VSCHSPWDSWRRPFCCTGEGKANQYYLRGFNLDHGTDFLTEVDGVPVNLVSHAHGQGYTDTGFLIPELVRTLGYQRQWCT